MAKKSIHTIAPSVFNLGRRFVFFSSLYDVSPSVQHFFQPIINKAEGYKQEAEAMLTGQDISTSQQLSNMQIYINFMKQMADEEQRNAIEFVQKTQRQWKNNKKLPKELDEHIQQFNDSIKNGQPLSEQSYLQLMSLINSIMQKNISGQKGKNDTYIEMGKIVQQALDDCKKISPELYQILENTFLYEGPTQDYRKKIVELVRNTSDNFNATYAQEVSRKINSVITNLQKDVVFLDTLQQTFSNMSSKDLTNTLIAQIINYVSKLSAEEVKTITGKDMLKDFENKITNNFNNISKDYVTAVMNQVVTKREKTIEELAVTTGRGTGIKFYKLTAAAKRDFMLRYNIDPDSKEGTYLLNLKNKLNSVNANKSKIFENASKYINTAIKNNAINELQREGLNITKENLRNWAEQLKNNWTSSTISKGLSVKIDSGAIGELNAVAEAISVDDIVKSIENPGTAIKLKNDLLIYILFDEDKIKNKKNPNITIMQDAFSQIPKNFMNKYYNKGEKTNETNLNAAMDAYEETLKEIKEQIDNLVALKKISQKDAQMLYNELESAFSSGISVKDYMYATNDWGFHGGSIGTNIDKIMTNINTMYELGGITKTDAQKLFFAAINCGPDGFTSDLKDNLEMFLTGAAAILMFDDGFTASEEFLKKMKQKLGFNGPKSLHLFRVNNTYFPASYIYNKIYEGLMEVYSQLQFTVNIDRMPSMVHFTNNITEQQIKPSYTQMPSALKRWQQVKDDAAISTDIHLSFTFLAGFLDILENIPKAFDINT